MTRVDEQLAALRQHLQQLGSALVCFSGGIDSALVLAVAHEQLGARAVGLTAVSPSLPAREKDAAVFLAQQLGVKLQLVESQELARPDYVANRGDRCFHCKTELYGLAQSSAADWGFQHILNGTNADDVGDYRPGLTAAHNAAIKSPLLELGFSKADVRAIAKQLGLPIWDKPALACLASRIPHGESVTPERLRQIEALENTVLDLGFSQVRVRWHGPVARLELAPEQLAQACTEPKRSLILKAGQSAGFSYVAIDLAGYVSGSLNRLLPGRALPILQ